jgi:hypothetical protein
VISGSGNGDGLIDGIGEVGAGNAEGAVDRDEMGNGAMLAKCDAET